MFETAAATFSTLAPGELSQHARLLRLETPLGDALTVERFSGSEAVCALFSFSIDCLAPSAELDVASLLGREVSLRLLQADGGLRTWHGMVADVDALGADGGLARYRLRVVPWLAALALRRDSFIYQDKTVVEIVTDIFSDYPLASFKFDLSGEPVAREVCTQYRESDLAFVQRLLAEEGLSFRFEHDQQDAGDEAPACARHQLVIFDTQASRPDCPLDPIRFHRVAATEATDTIDRFAVRRNLQSNAVVRSAWHDVALHAFASEAEAADRGNLTVLQDFDGTGHRRYRDAAQAERHASDRLRYLESRQVRFEGAGSVRVLAAAHNFTLSQHERFGGPAQQQDSAPADHGGNQFTVLAIRHEASNNLGAQTTQVLAQSALEPGTYRNTFIAQARNAHLVPAFHARPTAPESVVAVVVASGESPMSTGRDLKIKVQFAWQRGANPLPGGLAHQSLGDDQGNAPGDASSGTWLRLATGLAGPNWGTHLLPRKDTEVLVEFLDGDIDQPVVVAQLYNDHDLPPFSAGEQAPANHPGTLTGWHSHSLDGSGANQWLIDDATGQLRMRLSASAAASALGLGHLIDQDLKTANRGAWRGLGFELRTDAWTVLRSGQGLLLSSVASAQARHPQGFTDDALRHVRSARDAARRLSDAGQVRQALPLAANGCFDPLVDALDPKADGAYPASVNGQKAALAQGTERSGSEPVPRVAGPRIVVDAANSLTHTSPAATSLFAGRNNLVTALTDAHLAASQTFSAASGKATSLYVQDGGIKATAGDAPLTVQAHDDALDLLAGQDISVTSTEDSIEILARKSITLKAAGASITLDGGNIVFKCPGLFSVKASSHDLSGGARTYAALPVLPTALAAPDHRERFRFVDQATGEPIAGVPYFVELADGDFVHGTTDEDGHTEVALSEAPQIARCFVGMEARKRMTQVK